MHGDELLDLGRIRGDALERIFRPFERAVSVRHYGWLGLGLFIARTVVEGLGGSISVRSAPNVSSTFIVEVPLGEPS